MPAQDDLIVFRKKFGLKKIKITGETATAHQEAADEFPDAIMNIIDEKGYLPVQVFKDRQKGPTLKEMATKDVLVRKRSEHQNLMQEGMG